MNELQLTLSASASGPTALGCVTCNKQLRDAIFTGNFYPNLLAMLTAFIVLAVLVAALVWLATGRHAPAPAAGSAGAVRTPVPLAIAGIVLGIGAGGFVDGIALHQLLQWHEMLSAKLPPDTLLSKSVNMFWDGIFHAFTLLVTLIGIYLLWNVSRRKDADHAGRLLLGGMIAGWGLFNVIEGIINHQVLGLHNVREQSLAPGAWNGGFVIFGVVQVTAGWLLLRRRFRHTAAHPVTEHS